MKITSLKFCFLLFIWFYYLKTYSQNKDTVKIGNQLWTSKNLNVTRFRNGDLIPQAKTKTEWIKAGKEKKPAWCYYNNDSVLGKKYGKLYNWFAVIDQRDLAPFGWRLPYAEDYSQLARFHDFDVSEMKSKLGWFKADKLDVPTNKYHFNAQPSGLRRNDGSYSGISFWSIFWSITSYENTTAWSFNIGKQGNNLSSEQLNGVGGSVRLIKDEGLRKSNDDNDKLRIQIESDLIHKKYDSASIKLNFILNSIGYKYYYDYQDLLECYVKNYNFFEAEKFFNENIQTITKYNGKESNFYNSFGWNLILSKFYQPASKYLNLALEKYPKDTYLKGNLAHAYLLSGEFEKATKIYIENIVKIDSIPWEHSEGPPVITNNDYYGKIITDDTTWIKMVKEDFIYFKNEGIHSPYFDSITIILNLKKENAKLRKESDGYYYYIDNAQTIYNDTNGYLCDRNNMIYDSCIYKLKKILASNYFIEEYDYERLLDYYFGKNDLINAESFFNYCIENHKGNEVDLYNQYSNGLARFKLYQSAIKYRKLAINIQPNNPNLKIGLADLLICSGSFYEAKKIFIENIVQFDSITGDWIYEDQAHDTIWIFDTVKNIQTFDRIEYEPTSWMKKVSRWWEMNQFFCLKESNFKLIEDLMTKEHEALIRKRLELEKIKK